MARYKDKQHNLCVNCVLGLAVLPEEGSSILPKGMAFFEYFTTEEKVVNTAEVARAPVLSKTSTFQFLAFSLLCHPKMNYFSRVLIFII